MNKETFALADPEDLDFPFTEEEFEACKERDKLLDEVEPEGEEDWSQENEEGWDEELHLLMNERYR